MPRRHWPVVVGVIVPMLLMAACSNDNKACGLVGAETGVMVRNALPPTTAFDTIRACVDEVCTDTPRSVATREPRSFLVPNSAVDGSPASLTVSFVKTGQRVAGGSITVTPTKYEPNGPGCDPIGWTLRVTMTPSGLTPGA